MTTKEPIENQVISTLRADPRIPAAKEIAVHMDGGCAILRGTVESFRQRRAAVEDAKRIKGVYEVDDRLKVSLNGADRRPDDQIRGAALQRLMWDVEVPSETVNVKVSDGWVTLKGDVGWQFQSDAAYNDVSSLYGVRGVTNEITVNP